MNVQRGGDTFVAILAPYGWRGRVPYTFRSGFVPRWVLSGERQYKVAATCNPTPHYK